MAFPRKVSVKARRSTKPLADLQQHVIARGRVERVTLARHGGQREFETVPRQDLEGREEVGKVGSAPREQCHGRLGRCYRQKGGLNLRRLGEQLETGSGDDPERSLRAHKHLLQIVTRIVLPQLLEPVPHLPIGKHDLQAEDQIAHHAVAHDVDAASVGGNVAADLAAPLGADPEREEAVLGRGGRVHSFEHAARLDDHGEVERVDLAHAVETLEANDDFGTVLGRRRAAD